MRIEDVRAGAAALVLVGSLTACTRAVGDPAPAAAPAVTRSTPGDTGSPTVPAAGYPGSPAVPAAGFSAFATPCPRVGDRGGAALAPLKDTPEATTADCSFGDQTRFPRVTSVSTITKPGHPKGTPEQVTTETYRSLVRQAQPDAVDGVTARKVAGLGDEATLVISFKDNLALLIVRSGNALIQAMARIDAHGDRERELIELQSQEPVVTALARALLAELR